MDIILHAQPYDMDATGFYFTNKEEFQYKCDTARNASGETVEEFEIQIIDGEAIDCELAQAWGLNQQNVNQYLKVTESWSEYEKLTFIIAVGEAGYDFDETNVTASDFDVDVYFVDSMKELAEEFIAEGLFGEIPDHLHMYLDLDKLARDLSYDFVMTNIAGKSIVYRCN